MVIMECCKAENNLATLTVRRRIKHQVQEMTLLRPRRRRSLWANSHGEMEDEISQKQIIDEENTNNKNIWETRGNHCFTTKSTNDDNYNANNRSRHFDTNSSSNKPNPLISTSSSYSSRRIFSNVLTLPLVLVLLSSTCLISLSNSSEVSSFQRDFGGGGQSSMGSSNPNNNNNNNNPNANNNALYNTGSSSPFVHSLQQQSITPSITSVSGPSSSGSVFSGTGTTASVPSTTETMQSYFIAGKANEIRKVNSTALMILTKDVPFVLQFRTVCPFGNIVYDDNIAISINSSGNMTSSTKPKEFFAAVHHNVADGQWHSLTFKGTVISLDDHDIHPDQSRDDRIHDISWDANTSSENNDPIRLNHVLNFFDGFVGCIRVPKFYENLTGRDHLQSHEDMVDMPDSSLDQDRLDRGLGAISLMDLFGLHKDDFPPCDDLTTNLTEIYQCFDPDTFISCKKCHNNAVCEAGDPEQQPYNNHCVCPPSSEDIEYTSPYCEGPPNMQHAEESTGEITGFDADHNLRSADNAAEDHSSVAFSSPSNIDTVLASLSSTSESSMTTTTTEQPIEKPINLADYEGQCPCEHGGNCTQSRTTLGLHFCNCSGSGYEGKFCNIDINECERYPNFCQNEGICANRNGTFQCYCIPGWSGKNCQTNYDDCLSHPCMHGKCEDEVNDYRCICEPGYSGINCEHEVNECEGGEGYVGNPCKNGATCEDLLNSYLCACPPGYSGTICEIDVDECESQPCAHEGQCIDKVNGFECNCTDTGFFGDQCEINVDDCEQDVEQDGLKCLNGANCIDKVKDYECVCHPGYTGRACEKDIPDCETPPCMNGGECFEKSNQSLYNEPYESKLRQLLSSSFSYENAAGYVCLCPAGYEGENCHIDIDECSPPYSPSPSPCGENGNCKDGINSYSCDCHPGFEGDHCEHEIDECLSSPCVRGTCIDRRADFECKCPAKYGAKNCSVPLKGCITEKCNSNGKCEDTYDEGSNKHGFKCNCDIGFAGTQCQLETTMSFNGSGAVEIIRNDRPFENGNYELRFRFRTTLSDVLLVVGEGLTFFSLILSGGRLNLQSSLLNNLNGIYSGTNLSNADWHKVWIAVNNSHIALAADSEQTIYPINPILISEEQEIQTGFNTTILGGATGRLGFLNQNKLSLFIGCMQEIAINEEPVIPGVTFNMTAVEIGCKRRNQCSPNPCRNDGTCTDLWRNFTCSCKRPFLGDKCQHEYIAATFHHENTSNSLAAVNISSEISNKFSNTFDISMFVRTRHRNGTIFLLGNEHSGNYSVYLEAGVGEVGNLIIQAKWSEGSDDSTNSRPETYAVDGLNITDGWRHLISIQKDKTLVKISVNGTEHFRKSVSNKIKFNPSVIYIGGKPSYPIEVISSQPESLAASLESGGENGEDSTLLPELTVEAASVSNSKEVKMYLHPLTNDNGNLVVSKPFKGVIQDVRVNFSSTEHTPSPSFGGHGQSAKSQNHYVVEFFQLDINSTYAMGDPLGEVTKQNILEGTVSDDTCRINPCENNGICEVTWNDFQCKCSEGYDGKTCQVLLHCARVSCPTKSVCNNIGWLGFECIAEAAFDGRGTVSPHYHLESTELENVTFDEASFRFRSKQAGNVLYLANRTQSFRMGLEVNIDPISNQSYETLAIYINGHKHTSKTTRILDGQWHNVTASFMVNDNGVPTLVVAIDKKGVDVYPDINGTFSFHELVISPDTEIIVGSLVEQRDHYLTDHNDSHDNHIGHAEDSHNKYYRGCLADVKLGAYLLPFVTPSQLEEFNSEEKALVKRTAPTAFYVEETSPRSEVQIHLGCILCYDDECMNQGHCDSPAEKYECTCPTGFSGGVCQVDDDECLQNECQHGSTCRDQVANYTCICPPGFEGWKCDIETDECESSPCHNGGTCIDGLAKYTCACTEEYFGNDCTKRRKSSCRDDPCEHGAACKERAAEYPNDVTFECHCTEGWEGETCSEKIDYCKGTDCENGGTCNNKEVGFECECVPGYDGPRCEFNRDECESQPCLHTSRCNDLVNDYSCDCRGTGYYGRNCEYDENECISMPGICPPMKECENTIGSYRCICPDPFMCGDDCRIRDPCYEDGNVTCQNGGLCSSTCHDEESKKWNCECSDHYRGEFCEMLTMAQPQDINLLLIIIPVLAAFLIAAFVGVIILVRMARRKRATRGVYSPSQQEYCNPRVELDNVMKPPPEERLI